MSAQREMLERQRSISLRAAVAPPAVFIAEVDDYKADGSGAAQIWVLLRHADDTPQKLGPIPIMSQSVGPTTPFRVAGQTAGPERGALAIILDLAANAESGSGDAYVCAGFLPSLVRPSPPAPAGEQWTMNKNGSYSKLTNDGTTIGDKLGGNKTGGGDYLEARTRAGHSDIVSDTSQTYVRAMADGSQTIHDAVAHEVSHLAANVTLGARAVAMSAVNAALNKSHLSTFESSLRSARLDDLVKFAAAMTAVGIPNSGGIIAQLASLLGVQIPSGSSIVKIAN